MMTPRTPLAAAIGEPAAEINAAARLRVCDEFACVRASRYARKGQSPYDAALEWLQATSDTNAPDLKRIAVLPASDWRTVKKLATIHETVTLVTAEDGYDLKAELIEAYDDTDDDRLADLMAERLLTELLSEDDGNLSPEVRARITRARDSLLEGLKNEELGDLVSARDLELYRADNEAAGNRINYKREAERQEHESILKSAFSNLHTAGEHFAAINCTEIVETLKGIESQVLAMQAKAEREMYGD